MKFCAETPSVRQDTGACGAGKCEKHTVGVYVLSTRKRRKILLGQFPSAVKSEL